MVLDPGTAILISSAIAAGGQGIGSLVSKNKATKAAAMRIKQMKRETRAGLLEDAQQRNAELEGHRLSSRARSGKRSSQTMQNTADLVRGAFNI
jgi:hypothetical protein